jgi:hypothetical protein
MTGYTRISGFRGEPQNVMRAEGVLVEGGGRCWVVAVMSHKQVPPLFPPAVRWRCTVRVARGGKLWIS